MRIERPGRPPLLTGQEACGLSQTMRFLRLQWSSQHFCWLVRHKLDWSDGRRGWEKKWR